MKTLFITFVATCLVALVSCQQGSQPTSSTAGQNPVGSLKMNQDDVPFSTTLINTCCNDTVTISGNEHIVNNDDFTKIHINLSGLSGTGTSGNTYHGGLVLEEISRDTNGSDGFNAVEHFVMTAPGGCKFKLTMHIHMTVDANGNLRVDRNDFTIDCF